MDTSQNTDSSDRADKEFPTKKWRWLIYIMLCNVPIILYLALSMTSKLFAWFEFLFVMSVFLGGILYSTNRHFLKSWFWKSVFWLMVGHFLLIAYLFWGPILNSSLHHFLIIGFVFFPNLYLIFKLAYKNEIKSSDNAKTKTKPKKSKFRLILLMMAFIVIGFSFIAVVKHDDKKPLPIEEKLEKIQTEQYEIGLMYQNGNGVQQDAKLAALSYRKAAEQGHVMAQRELATLYANGQGVLQDDQQAAVWFEKSAEQGDAYSQYVLGIRYTNGNGVAKDTKKAEKWFRKAAEQGDQHSQFKLGLLLKDDKESAKWYRESAKQGNVQAKFFLGLLYYHGKGLSQDYKQAEKWFKRAAQQGYADAQHLLGFMYYAGQGQPKNDEQAMMWFQKAAAKGNTKAINILKSIEENSDPNKLTAPAGMIYLANKWLVRECKEQGGVPITGLSNLCRGATLPELMSCMEKTKENDSKNMSCEELDSKIALCKPAFLKKSPKALNAKGVKLLTAKYIECLIK